MGAPSPTAMGGTVASTKEWQVLGVPRYDGRVICRLGWGEERLRWVVAGLVVFGCSEPPAQSPESSASSGDASDSGPSSSDAEPGSTTAGDAGTTGGAATSGTDGGGSESVGDDSGTVEPTGVPMFVAQGHMGRTIVSCDDGRSWVGDRSNDDDVRCFDGLDCDHDPGAGRGIAWGHGYFVATFGWGSPGGVQRSADGLTWESVLEETTFSGVAFGADVFVAGSPSPRVSLDDGATWDDVGSAGFEGSHVRRFGFVEHDEGRFVLVGDSAVSLSSDGGSTWWTPDELPEGCGVDIQTRGGIAYGNATIVIVGGDGQACTSRDGGVTFTIDGVGAEPTAHLVFDGARFSTWSAGERWSSEDGRTWTATPLEPEGLRLGPVAIGDSGTLVGVRGGWQTWYEEQVFYRSIDGVSWEPLPADAYVGSHPIRAITFGYGSPSELCPEP